MNNKEAMQALLDGKKIRDLHWNDPLHHVFMRDNGEIVHSHDDFGSLYFQDFNIDWEIFEEPKKKKTITFYEYIDKFAGCRSLVWHDSPPEKSFDEKTGFIFTGNTREIEIDES